MAINFGVTLYKKELKTRGYMMFTEQVYKFILNDKNLNNYMF